MVINLHEGYKKANLFFTPENASSYDIVVNIATLGRDRFWKKRIIDALDAKLRRSSYYISSVSLSYPFQSNTNLDLASGTGILSGMIERESGKHEASRSVVCLDLAFHYLQIAKKKCARALLTNATAELLPYRAESFDSITSSYLSKYINAEAVVKECWRVLKSRGLVVFHDFTYPSGWIARSLWNFYFGLLKLVAKGVITWAHAFQGLDRVIKSSNWVNEISRALRVNGFSNIIIRFYTMQTSAIVLGQKP